mgnify:CR=1 FL=1|tara:strand:+ start:116 stop:286 length:171 start_codon:yes stop_codon:yes gene_type:complete
MREQTNEPIAININDSHIKQAWHAPKFVNLDQNKESGAEGKNPSTVEFNSVTVGAS